MVLVGGFIFFANRVKKLKQKEGNRGERVQGCDNRIQDAL